MNGPIRTLADAFLYRFAVCLICKRLLCRDSTCKSPLCAEICHAKVTGYNTNFKYVCALCYKKCLDDFERQFPRKLLKKVRVEDADEA